MQVRKVNRDDCSSPYGCDFNPLHSSVKNICPGLEGDTLWEKIRELHQLGLGDNCDAWVERMKTAIGIWNANNPQNCSAIKSAYGVRIFSTNIFC